MRPRVFAFINQKGGVGKTTSVLNIGSALALEGKKVLLIDLDPQGSLTKSSGFRDVSKQEKTVAEALAEGEGLIWTIRKRESDHPVSVAVADLRLSSVALDLADAPDRDFRLKKLIDGLRARFDYVLIDCAPSLTILTIMAMVACDEVIVPVSPQFMPLDGVADLLTIMNLTSKRVGRKIRIGGVLVTLVTSRRSLDRQVIEAIRERFPEETYQTVIKNLSKVAEAPTEGEDLFEYDPRGEATEAYRQVAREILQRDENKKRRK